MRLFKFLMGVALLAAVSLLLAFSATAADISPTLPKEEWEGFESSIADEIKDRLPSGALDGENGFAESVEKMSSGEYIVQVVLDIVGVELGGAATLFFSLCALVLLSAVFSAFCNGLDNPALSRAIRFCSSGAVISVVIYTQYGHFEMLRSMFDRLWGMMNGIIPMVASIWAMGGNVNTASVGSASFGVILTVSQGLFASSIIPICCILTVFGFCDGLTDEMRTGRIMNAVKKIYIFILGAVMTVLLTSLGAQTALASAADTATARTARLISGTVIPVLGGSVGETFRNVAAGVVYLKNVFGIGAIIMIALLVLPVIATILLTRFVFMLCGGLADMLGCPSEARLFEGLSEAYGFMLAVVAGVAVMFVLALYIFMQTVVAVM